MSELGSVVPTIDVAPLVLGAETGSVDEQAARATASAIDAACRGSGFFRAIGHGLAPGLQQRMIELARQFFDWPLERKLRYRMELGGPAWRGYFAVGDELTSGLRDRKEGLYFGLELHGDHPRVAAGTPLHGANLFPELTGLREAVLEYLATMTGVGQAVAAGIALGLGLAPDAFRREVTRDPLVLLRMFHYPPPDTAERAPQDQPWGVGEHTDYGLLTLLLEDDVGGLQVRSGARWIDVPPLEGALVCNIGDMLERVTGGHYRSTAHRVRNVSKRGRISIPFFFDPGFDARVERLAELVGGATRASGPETRASAGGRERWDHADPHAFEGTYGEYLLAKVSKVFPGLGRRML